MMEFVNNNREAILSGLFAILGSMATLITEHYLRQTGKVTAMLYSFETSMLKPDMEGGFEKTDKVSDADMLDMSFQVDLYNSSRFPQEPKEVRNGI